MELLLSEDLEIKFEEVTENVDQDFVVCTHCGECYSIC